MQAFGEQVAMALRTYTTANDAMRSLAAEMRLRQPGIAAEAESLYRASGVPNRGDMAESLNPPDNQRRNAESAFIDKVRARLDELQ
jgi:hypothetical protein